MGEMHFLVIQHLAIEPPGMIGETICDHGHQLTTILSTAGEGLPQTVEGYDGLVVMGGPQSASDTHLPYIDAELTLLKQAIALDLPVIGICLGAQLLAKAAGSEIIPSPQRELGWYPVTVRPEAGGDPLFGEMAGTEMMVFQWHGESFTLPPDGKLLATHPLVSQQAFRLGRCQYGLQFHVEVDASTIEAWVEAGASERLHLGEAGVAAIRHDMAQYLPAMQAWCRRMTGQWLTLAAAQREKH